MGGIVSMFKKFANNDEGVSAVIGVILMVAITVILAAVIAAFVFGMVGGTKRGYTVAATAQRTGPTQIVVSYHGGQDSSHVTGITVAATAGTPAASGVLGSSVGSTNVISGATASDTVTVTAKWDDGSSTVILMQTL
jgi:flagellin-like protein